MTIARLPSRAGSADPGAGSSGVDEHRDLLALGTPVRAKSTGENPGVVVPAGSRSPTLGWWDAMHDEGALVAWGLWREGRS